MKKNIKLPIVSAFLMALLFLAIGCGKDSGGGGDGEPKSPIDVDNIELIATPRGGTAPVNVSFVIKTIEGDLPTSQLTKIEWDFDGDDVVDETTSGSKITNSYAYTVPGQYMPSAKLHWDGGWARALLPPVSGLFMSLEVKAK